MARFFIEQFLFYGDTFPWPGKSQVDTEPIGSLFNYSLSSRCPNNIYEAFFAAVEFGYFDYLVLNGFKWKL